jgi:hypothetical protein
MAGESPTREDTYAVYANVDGRDLGVFDTWSGGETDSEESTYYPGGMAIPISLGGRQTFGNVTIGRYYDTLRDHPLYKWLSARAGRARGSAYWVPLSINGAVAGEPVLASGTFKRVQHSDIDSTGGDAATLELEFTVEAIG